jgi:chorismate-pyruvate lyase
VSLSGPRLFYTPSEHLARVVIAHECNMSQPVDCAHCTSAQDASACHDDPRHLTLQPLLRFYERNHTSAPEIVFISGDTDLPHPFRTLLNHQRNMTPTLEQFFNCKLSLCVLDKVEDRSSDEDVLRRWIRLEDSDHTPFEFGSINIMIHNMPAELHEAIREGVRPLATLLLEAKIEQRHSPRAFFTFLADDLLRKTLGLTCTAEPVRLYGRCNCITRPDGAKLAEVVEVMPPFQSSDAAATKS